MSWLRRLAGHRWRYPGNVTLALGAASSPWWGWLAAALAGAAAVNFGGLYLRR